MADSLVNETTSTDTYDLLKDDVPVVEDKKEEVVEKEEEEPAEEEVELVEEEEKEEVPDEEELQLTTPVRRKEILAKYPTIFKDFPYLEAAYYREQQYTEILPTLDDAKEAVSRSEALSNIERDLTSGNAEGILRQVRESDPNAFALLVDNYLPNLAKVDSNAYYHVVGNVASNIIATMVNEAGKLGNEDLKTAAMLVNQFVFGKTDFQAAERFSKEEHPEKATLEQERAKFNQEKFESARDDLATRTTNVIKSTIDSNIDPKQTMTDYVRKNAVKDCMGQLEDTLMQDKQFRVVIDKLWEKAFKDNFSRNSLDKIRSTYLTKAKVVLPQLIQRTRNEALRGLQRTKTDDKDKRGPITRGKSTSSSNSGQKQEMPKGMKTIDFLMQD